jgi:hypothetical protein
LSALASLLAYHAFVFIFYATVSFCLFLVLSNKQTNGHSYCTMNVQTIEKAITHAQLTANQIVAYTNQTISLLGLHTDFYKLAKPIAAMSGNRL